MSIIQGTAKSSGDTDFYDFPIEDSLRFDGSSYLSWSPTQTSTNQNIWTYSSWVKRVNVDNQLRLYASGVYANDSAGLDLTDIYAAYTDNMLTYWDYTSGSRVAYVRSYPQLRDTSAWYHILVSYNSSSTPKMSFYINGNLLSTYGDQPSQMNHINVGSRTYYVAADNYGSSVTIRPGTFYLANFQFIDGQALDASYFGETKDDIWVPKTFDGTSSTGGSTVSTDYGTNGFLLDFSSISGTTINDTAPIDTNHSSANNWTATGF